MEPDTVKDIKQMSLSMFHFIRRLRKEGPIYSMMLLP